MTYRLLDDKAIIDFSGDYAVLIKASLGKKKSHKFGKTALYKLYRQSLQIQDRMFFQLLRGPEIPSCLHNYRVWEDDADTFKSVYEKHPLAELWEPYIISAVSDFIAFTESDREKADFLSEVKTKGVEDICTSRCDFVPLALSNFYWYLVRAKVDSDQEWPLDEMIAETTSMLGWANKYIDTDSNQIKARLSPYFKYEDMQVDEIKNHYRLVKLQDLSLGLEILYRKALLGANLNPLQRSYWSNWLGEVRRALSAVEDIGWEPGKSESERIGWRSSKLIVDQRPDALFDAATGAAISAVLLPQQSGAKPSELDCLSARTLLAYADRNGKLLTAAFSGSRTSKAKVDGFIEQIRARIEYACH